jgi:hypothetical protein
MARRAPAPIPLPKSLARRIWMNAQRLDVDAPFGAGPAATRAAVEHLGYVQIDTINVIERCHHHILYSRIPAYRRTDLDHAQRVDKSVFEYWTHALSYIPTRDLPFFLGYMRRYKDNPHRWFGSVTPADTRKALRLLRRQGPITIRDIDDDILVDKHHLWASRKPSKRALEFAFYCGIVTIASRQGMLKSYDLIDRHFAWTERPKAESERAVLDYLLDRGLRAQGLVSVDSLCHLDARRKPAMRALIDARVRRNELVPVAIAGVDAIAHWARPQVLDEASSLPESDRVHLLSPFDPLVIQRKRLAQFFDYDHLFEAYVPKEKRQLGYFALPALIGDRVVAAIDMKADRSCDRLRLQKWTWTPGARSPAGKRRIEEAMHRFARFQFARDDPADATAGSELVPE